MATAHAPVAARDDTGSCTPAQVVWLALLPCAALTLLALLVLGPPLGDALLAPRGMAFWPRSQAAVLPEPAEHGRYAIALLGPLLLSGAVLLAARRAVPAWPRALALLVPATQALLLAFLAACVWAQRTTVFGAPYEPIPRERAYFSTTTLLVAGALAAALAYALSRAEAVRRAGELLRDTPRRRAAAIAIATLLLAVWLLMAVNSEATVGATIGVVGANVSNWLDEATSVLNGQPPLVHLRAQYAQLWPYLSAGAMAVLGTSVGVFVATMLAGTAATMLAVLALLRRVAGSWLGALALWAPFLATSFFVEAGTLTDRYTPAHLFSLFPMRYGGAYVLAWLTVRGLDGARPRRPAWLFLVGGLVVVNNVEFGLPALGATLAALLWTERLTPRRAARLAGEAALGLAGAVAAVAALTLIVAGSLPHFGLALTFSRMFGLEGFGMLPMRTLGFHLVIYATFAAALVVATLRAIGGTNDRALTGALAWIGVFGLGAGAYFAGRSHPDTLIALFSAWALALALLLVAVVRDAAARPGWRPSIAALGLFAAAGLAVCSLAQTPAPWGQVERLGHTTPTPVLLPLDQQHAIAGQVRRGAAVAILAPGGHRIADALGVVDVTPYADIRLIAPRQLTDTIAALRAAGGTQLFLARWLASDEQLAALAAAGFRQTQVSEEADLATFVDTR